MKVALSRGSPVRALSCALAQRASMPALTSMRTKSSRARNASTSPGVRMESMTALSLSSISRSISARIPEPPRRRNSRPPSISESRDSAISCSASQERIESEQDADRNPLAANHSTIVVLPEAFRPVNPTSTSHTTSRVSILISYDQYRLVRAYWSSALWIARSSAMRFPRVCPRNSRVAVPSATPRAIIAKTAS